MKKHELINIIESLENFEKPKLQLEQYQTDAVATSDLLYHIAFENDDLLNNLILDLGCGTGNISIAAALLGADVLSVDIDADALDIAKRNAISTNISDKITFLKLDVNNLNLNRVNKYRKENQKKIVVITNPPFGVHKKGLDLSFLSKAIEIGDIIYSIHLYNEKSEAYLEKKIKAMGGLILEKSLLYMVIKHTYSFHKQKSKKIQSVLYKIVKKTNRNG